MPPLSRTHTDSAFVVAIIYSRKTDKKLSYRFRDKPVVCRKSPILTPPTLHLVPPWGRPRSNFADIFGVRKLESLGYRVVLFV